MPTIKPTPAPNLSKVSQMTNAELTPKKAKPVTYSVAKKAGGGRKK